MNTVPVGPSEPELADVIGSVPPLIPVPAWRLAVAGSGFAGYALAADAFDAPWQGISQLASLALYDFLNPARADYLPTVFGFVAAMLGLGFVFLVLGQARAGHADGRH